jgi:hypothetical protein
MYRPADPDRTVLQADWLSKHPQLVGELHVPCNVYEAEQPPQQAELVQLRSIASKALAPRKLVLQMQQPGDFLQRIGTKQLQSLSLCGITSLLPVATALQGLQLPALHQLSVHVNEDDSEQQQHQEQLDGEQHVAADPAAAGHPFVAALTAASELQRLELNIQLPAAAISQLPASLRDLTVCKLLGGSSVAQLAQLTHLVLQDPCCDARELVAAVASLPQLQQLELKYMDQSYPLDREGDLQEREGLKQVQQHAAVWGGLQQLRDLVVELPYDDLTKGESSGGQRPCSIAAGAPNTAIVPCVLVVCNAR